MNNSELQNKITAILEPELQQHDWFLVECKVQNGRVQVAVDADNGFTIENCVKLSRLLESELNAEFPFSDNYSLELGSPGMGNPFKVWRQYKKYTGRKVIIITTEGQTKNGKMIEVSDKGIVLETTKIEKKIETVTGQIEIPFTQIKSTALVVTF